jgi:hypothetical protein
MATGREKQNIPVRKPAVCRAGTVAMRSDDRARASAIEKPLTIATTFRSSPCGASASSTEPRSRPRREMQMMRLPRGKRGGTQRVALPEGYLDDLADATPPAEELLQEAVSGG